MVSSIQKAFEDAGRVYMEERSKRAELTDDDRTELFAKFFEKQTRNPKEHREKITAMVNDIAGTYETQKRREKADALLSELF